MEMGAAAISWSRASPPQQPASVEHYPLRASRRDAFYAHSPADHGALQCARLTAKKTEVLTGQVTCPGVLGS